MQRLLLDSNVLLLFIVGRFDVDCIKLHKRTRGFSRYDFERLAQTILQYRSIATTAAVLAEISNLLGNQESHALIAPLLIEICTPFDEVHHAKSEVFHTQGFERLGFADASLLAAADEDTVLLTGDLQLYLEASYQGRSVINFNHGRPK